MANNLSDPAKVELSVQRELRARIVEEIGKRHLSMKDLAKELDLLPSGAESLMERPEWPIEITLRVAERLGIKMNLNLQT